jgi:cell wall-associated NlpC family hydrolase
MTPSPTETVSMRSALATALIALLALAGCGSDTERPASAPTTAPRGGEAAMAPLPKARPKLVQPEAGKTTSDAVDALGPNAKTATNDDDSLPKPTGAASDTTSGAIGDPNAKDLSATKATALANGVALPPLDAPEAVLDVIRAGNIIARTPYKWGGGHGRFQDNGYDCSGSVSYALYYAGLIDGPHTSGDLMAYGKPGPGKWITLYANGGHVYMTVAGIRFDTSAADSSNHFSRWQNQLRSNAGFEVRHPPGL